MMNLKLTVTAAPPDSSLAGQSFEITTAGASLGRNSSNTCLLPDSERIVSSKHAAISYDLGQFQITDTSTNGTYINGSPTPIGPNNSAPLHDGDSLAIGKYSFSVSVVAAEAAAPVAPSGGSFLDELSPVASPNPEPVAPEDDFDKWLEPQASNKQPDPLWGAANVVHSELPSMEPEENDPLAAFEQAENAANPLDIPAQDDDPDWWKGSQEDNVAPVNQAFTPPPVQSVEKDLFAAPQEPAEPVAPAEPQPVIPEPVREETNPSGFALDAVADVQDADDLDALLGLDNTPAEPPEPPPAEAIPQFEKTEPPPHVEVAQVAESLAQSPPTDASSAAPTAPQPVAQAGGDTAKLLADLLELGQLDETQLQNLPPEVASVLRETVSKLLEMLRVRSSIKNELRLDRTMIQPVENNPLKFSLTEKDAMRYLFGEQSGAYMSGTKAVREAFADIEDHQVALLSGMRSAYEKMLNKFSPETLQGKFADAAAKGLLSSKKSRLWDAYEEYFDKLRHDPETSYNRLFGDDFASAYEEQIYKLKANKRD